MNTQVDSPPRRTDPRGLLIKAIRGMGGAILPIAAVLFGTGGTEAAPVVVITVLAGFFVVALLVAAISWYRLTYTTGPEDIRVEQGLLSLRARSVPYERIQDVSIERPFLARPLGLATIQFETGSGGKDEIDLRYVTVEEAQRLRDLVRERRDDSGDAVREPAGSAASARRAAPMFAMGPRRLVVFGLFEFSLVIFALLLAGAQQLDFLLPFEIYELENWARLFEGQRDRITGIGREGPLLAALAGLIGVVVLGVVTGIVRTFARESGFRLEHTSRGFRRQRGLFTRTDVTLPVHRVQAARVDTGLVRYRFGWHGLRFVSLASDPSGSSSHAVAPFARLEEIWPVVRAAGLEPPDETTEWRRPLPGPWIWHTVVIASTLAPAGLVVSLVRGSALPLAMAALAAVVVACAHALAWRRRRYARDDRQLYVRKGNLAPKLTIAPQVKLQTVEIAQGPIARWRGYATLHLGLAGGTLDIEGVPIAHARVLREQIVDRIAEVDFSMLAGDPGPGTTANRPDDESVSGPTSR